MCLEPGLCSSTEQSIDSNCNSGLDLSFKCGAYNVQE